MAEEHAVIEAPAPNVDEVMAKPTVAIIVEKCREVAWGDKAIKFRYATTRGGYVFGRVYDIAVALSGANLKVVNERKGVSFAMHRALLALGLAKGDALAAAVLKASYILCAIPCYIQC